MQRSGDISRTFLGLALLASVLASGCGDGEAPPHDPARGQHRGETEMLQARADGRVVVATVDGVAIYDDCVATQAAAGNLDRQAALTQCIDFEILAQAAQKRGLIHHPDVVKARKTEAARRLIDREFIARFPDADHVDRRQIEAIYDRARKGASPFYRPEFRSSVFVRAPVAKGTEVGSDADLAARTLAREIHAALASATAGKKRLPVEEFLRIADQVAAGRTIESQKAPGFQRHGNAVEPYAAALFAIPEVGKVSPPVRTQWGWDILLLTKISPEIDVPLDEAKDDIFARVIQPREYVAWESSLVKGRSIEINEDALARLQATEDASRFAPGEAPR